MAEIAPDRRLSLPDLPDTNSLEQDRRQIRQQVADALGVSPADVSVELVGERYQACIQGQDGAIQLEWADSHDFERVKTGSATPCLFGFGLPDEPITIGRLVAASEGLGQEHTPAVLAPRFRAALARYLGVAVGHVEVRNGASGLEARKDTGSWQPVQFDNEAEGRRIRGWAERELTTAATPLADFSRGAHDRAISVRPLTGLSDAAAIREVQNQLAVILEVPPNRILLSATGGQLNATVVPEDLRGEALSRLAEPFVGSRVNEVRTDSPADQARLIHLLSTSRSPRLSHLGVPPNPHVVRVPHYAPDLGRDQEIGRFRDDLTRALGTAAANIEVFLNDEGLAQARIRGHAQVYDLQFTTTEDFARFSRYVRENPGTGLDTLGQRRYDYVVDLGGRTGWPDAHGRTGFTESLQSRLYLDDAGNHQLRLGLDMAQALNSGPSQTLRLGYHHREVGGLDLLIARNADGKFSLRASDVESTMFTQMGQRFWGRLQHGDGGAWAIAGGTLLSIAGTVYAASRLLPETQKLDLPVDADVLNSGAVKVGLGVAGQLRVGGDDLGYDFHGVRGNVRENIASGVSASQRLNYNFDNQQLQLQTQTTIQRFNLGAESTYDFANQRFATTQVALSQNFPLNDRMNLTLGGGGTLNGDWRITSAQASTGVNYQLGDVWGFGVGGNVGWNRDAVGAIPAQRPAYGLDLRVRAHF